MFAFHRFTSYRHFMIFWSLIEPSLPLMIRTSRAKAAEKKNETISVVRPALTVCICVIVAHSSFTSSGNILHCSNTHSLPPQSLQPIDEFFLFLMYLAAGLTERDLANRFSVHQSTVSRIIATWTNFLNTLLGSVGIWMEKEDVQANLPEVFQDFPDTQVIVDCTELKCQTPSSLLLQSEMYSNYKSHCTMKGLIGMAPPWCNNLCVSLVWGVY